MILALSVIGYLTLIIGFSGVFSLTVPAWMGLVVMALGGLSWFTSWTKSSARPVEPSLVALGLLLIGVLSLMVGARAWFAGLVFVMSALHLAAAGEAAYLAYRRSPHPDFVPRSFFWRRFHFR